MKRLGVFFVIAGLASTSGARADVPPPPGRTRVSYKYRLAQPVDGRVVVAFPTYTDAGTPGQVMEAGKDYRTMQGYQPGIYSLDRADADALPQNYEAADRFLKARAAVCLKQMPRVFEVPTSNGFNEVTDVFDVAMVDGRCRARLAFTTYGGGGKVAQGGVLNDGKRTVPAPFGGDVPAVTESGLDLSAAPAAPAEPKGNPAERSLPPTAAEPRGVGCAGCVTAGAPVPRGGWAAVAMGLLGALRAARRRAGRPLRANR